MKGYILTYNPELSKREIINVNYNLFGKVLSKQGKKYFYPGILDMSKIHKFSNGCYFVKLTKNILESISLDDRVLLYPCEIDLPLTLITARKIKQDKYNGIFVKNLE